MSGFLQTRMLVGTYTHLDWYCPAIIWIKKNLISFCLCDLELRSSIFELICQNRWKYAHHLCCQKVSALCSMRFLALLLTLISYIKIIICNVCSAPLHRRFAYTAHIMYSASETNMLWSIILHMWARSEQNQKKSKKSTNKKEPGMAWWFRSRSAKERLDNRNVQATSETSDETTKHRKKLPTNITIGKQHNRGNGENEKTATNVRNKTKCKKKPV